MVLWNEQVVLLHLVLARALGCWDPNMASSTWLALPGSLVEAVD